jgi:hypothetical protein
MWFVVARKRLPTPFALRTTKPNPTAIVLPVPRSPVTALASAAGTPSDAELPLSGHAKPTKMFSLTNSRRQANGLPALGQTHCGGEPAAVELGHGQ